MPKEKPTNRAITGDDAPAGLRNLTRVTEGHEKKSGSNPAPRTPKPLNFRPPGQAGPPAGSVAPAAAPAKPAASSGDTE